MSTQIALSGCSMSIQNALSDMTIADLNLNLRYQHPHVKCGIVGYEVHAFDDCIFVSYQYHPTVHPERLLTCDVRIPKMYVFVAREQELT